MIKKRVQKIGNEVMRFCLNDMPTWFMNAGYDYYSMIYQGQISLGLPVSKELLLSQEQIRSRAAGKLALTLYHMFFRVTGRRIPRSEIKAVLLEELDKRNIHITEQVILLTRNELKLLATQRFNIPRRFLHLILQEAERRKILRETLKKAHRPAYFESEIDERELNGRGDYEIVYYRDYTDEGKSIGFRRLASIEEVTAGDNHPSILMIPGFANNSNVFNLNNHYSLAKDMADRGCWVYLFDPRGMGVNEGKFDPFYTIDTLIDHDLPTVTRFIHSRSKGKPVVLLGHSMGGLISECMLLNWGIRQKWDDLVDVDPETKAGLDKILPPLAEARRNIAKIRGVITLGGPKSFQKMSHLFFPTVLWMNHLSRFFRLSRVPVQEFFWSLTQMPVLKWLVNRFFYSEVGNLNFLICPANHCEDKLFMQKYLHHSLESVPLGLGFQFLKAIYNGEGFKRMDSSLNYPEFMCSFPANVPVFHFWGTKDPLAPPSNVRYSQRYPHRIKKIYRLEKASDLKSVEIEDEPSQLIDFIIEGASHIDLLYGKAAKEIIHPLLMEIIPRIWHDWAYDGTISGPH